MIMIIIYPMAIMLEIVLLMSRSIYPVPSATGPDIYRLYLEIYKGQITILPILLSPSLLYY